MSDAVNRFMFCQGYVKAQRRGDGAEIFFLNNFFKDHELKLISCSFDIICSQLVEFFESNVLDVKNVTFDVLLAFVIFWKSFI